jgi:hypothetical protein
MSLRLKASIKISFIFGFVVSFLLLAANAPSAAPWAGLFGRAGGRKLAQSY